MYDYDIDPENGFISVTIEGFHSEEERIDLMRSILADPRYVPGLNVLIDRRGARDTGTFREIEKFVRILAQERQHVMDSRCAVVVSRPAHYGMVRTVQAYAEVNDLPIQVIPFYEIEDAREWLSKRPSTAS